jgi:hypothetical protein
MYVLLDNDPVEVAYGGVNWLVQPIDNTKKRQFLRESNYEAELGRATKTDNRLYAEKLIRNGIIGWDGIPGIQKNAEGVCCRVVIGFSKEARETLIQRADDVDFNKLVEMVTEPGAAAGRQLAVQGESSGPTSSPA